jgi:hypothetical protein
MRRVLSFSFREGQPARQEESFAVDDNARTVFAGFLLALCALGLLLPAAAEATLVPRTVFAEEFGYHG